MRRLGEIIAKSLNFRFLTNFWETAGSPQAFGLPGIVDKTSVYTPLLSGQRGLWERSSLALCSV